MIGIWGLSGTKKLIIIENFQNGFLIGYGYEASHGALFIEALRWWT